MEPYFHDEYKVGGDTNSIISRLEFFISRVYILWAL